MEPDPNTVAAYFKSAVEEVRRPTDIFLFMMTLASLLAILIIIAMLTNNLVLWLVFAVIILSLIIVRGEQIWLLNNAIKLDDSPYTYLDDIIKEICANMGVKRVSAFAVRDTEDPVFVIGHFRRYSIVFDAEFLEVLSNEEARAMLVREIAHVKFGSAELHSFIRPLTEKLHILGLGTFIRWMFGFWSRKTEETANRMALLYTRDPRTLILALVKSRLGGKFTELLSDEGLLAQDKQTHGFFKWLAESGSYESFLSTQAKEILEYAEQHNIPISDKARELLHGKS
jgi:Zn-dependent protease with chaperone function